MDRRGLLLSAIGIAAAVSSSPAVGQTQIREPLDLDAFAKSIFEPKVLGNIFVDVEFVHSWRTQVAPRGYESSAEWEQRATANRGEVWKYLQDKSVQGILTRSDALFSYEKTGLSVFEKSKDDFDRFLMQIGVEPSGLSAHRILTSLRAYSLLNAAAFGDDVTSKAQESFFWPFC
ncbi:hypothetical protein NKI95_02090 [Mesorhizobium sp. M0306]|uniref:hypothetical protein n=1 Tax=Mesorhizobium sp. M0306 TaxID=2956932 RepID=UPI003335D272